MPQFRQDFITKEWVIVAPERAKRPDQFARKGDGRGAVPEHDPSCPFCPGNEHMTPPPTLVRGDGAAWALRVVPNKFAAVSPDISPERHAEGRFLSADGYGVAEVIVESPRHDATLATSTEEEVHRVVEAYRSRYAALSADHRVNLVTVFRNHGKAAGTSLVHPHSQVIATPIVPPRIRQLMQQAVVYHDTHGTCPHCDLIQEELSREVRVVLDTPHYLAFCPYASRIPFETRICPKRHTSRIDTMTGEETAELARVLRLVLRKLYDGLNDPDYNIAITTSPTSDGELSYDHWRLTITPRTTLAAGFELGTGIFINTMLPEDAAKFLREQKAE